MCPVGGVTLTGITTAYSTSCTRPYSVSCVDWSSKTHTKCSAENIEAGISFYDTAMVDFVSDS